LTVGLSYVAADYYFTSFTALGVVSTGPSKTDTDDATKRIVIGVVVGVGGGFILIVFIILLVFWLLR